MIHIHEELLSEEQCDELIAFYNKNSNRIEPYESTQTIRLRPFKHDPFIFSILNRIDKLCKSFWLPPSYTITLQNMELVRWPVGSYKGEHIDNPEDVFAVIVYLNDDYEGGETFFTPTLVIKPETGKGVIFSNSKYAHSVPEVKNKDRYTLALWYTKVYK